MFGRGYALVLCGFAVAGRAQDSAPQDSIPTLHAYANLVQVPTLVLSYSRELMPLVASNRFYVRLDGGPRFRVTHARIEGDDPITLYILLDLNQGNAKALETMEDGIGSLVPGALHAVDRVTVYSLRCNLVRSADISATDGTKLASTVKTLIESQDVRLHPGAQKCPVHWHLWDTLAGMTTDLGMEPGRRVILAVTDGEDWGSKTTWNRLRMYAQEKGVAIFGMVQAASLLSVQGRRSSQEPIFNSVCELSGGMVLPFDAKRAAVTLAQFVGLVRGRYIVEFPRPMSTTGGYHDMEITIANSDAFIRPAGASAPVEDPKVLDDPMTVPMDPADAPQLGKRKVVSPQ